MNALGRAVERCKGCGCKECRDDVAELRRLDALLTDLLDLADDADRDEHIDTGRAGELLTRVQQVAR